MNNVIDSFTGEYAYLSNSYMAHIRIGHKTYMCVESAFQALRVCDSGMSGMFDSMTGNEARRIGLDMTERADWDDIKWDVLYKLTLEKFKQNQCLENKLLSTGDTVIKDEFLGDILMRVRDELRTQNKYEVFA